MENIRRPTRFYSPKDQIFLRSRGWVLTALRSVKVATGRVQPVYCLLDAERPTWPIVDVCKSRKKSVFKIGGIDPNRLRDWQKHWMIAG